MSNIYYSPEDFGLTVVDSVDFADSYEFDIYVVWKTQDGRLVWAHDSGCSCPTPFEGYHSVDELEVLNRHTWDGFERAVMDAYSGSTADKMDFLRTVEKEYKLIKQ